VTSNSSLLSQKPAQFSQILGYLNNTLKPTLIQTFSRIKVYNALILPSPSYGSEILTLGKRIKMIDVNQAENFQNNSWVYPF